MSTRNRKAVSATWEAVPSEEVRPGVTRRGFGTDDMILVLNECLPGMELSPHKHDDFDQIATFLTGRALYHVDGEPYEVGPGSLLLIPAGQMHYIEPLGEEPVKNLDVFAPARADYAHLLAWMDEHGGGDVGELHA